MLYLMIRVGSLPSPGTTCASDGTGIHVCLRNKILRVRLPSRAPTKEGWQSLVYCDSLEKLSQYCKIYMNIDTRIKGEITEMKCQLFCLEQGYVISKPVLDNARYDLLLDYNNKIYRIQIKTSRWMSDEHEGIVFNCKS